MSWWVTDPDRARSEQRIIAELAEGADWLTGVRWRLGDGLALTVDFEIMHGGQAFPMTMTYASLHPHAPPQVVPRDGDRVSGHQYGDGQLCLEFRSDNWVASITGAMLVESTYRLIAGERGVGNREVPSAHHSTLGQRTRGQPFRFLVTTEVVRGLCSLSPGMSVAALVSERHHARTFVATLVGIDGAGEVGAWVRGTAGAHDVPARIICIQPGARVRGLELDELGALLDVGGFHDDAHLVRRLGADVCIILLSDEGPILYFVYNKDGGRLGIEYRTLIMPTGTRRLPEAYDALSRACVGIVGAGSLGSKVAVSLVRAGARRFVVVDDDVFMPGNLVRNELGQAALGVHKVDALAVRLTDVCGEVDVVRRRVSLGGQESSGTTDSVMSALAECDVIVDATADPHAFNFCAAVAMGHRKPLIWGEVFGGGIGGLIARARPDREPEPLVARSQIAAWFDARGVPAPFAPEADPYGGGADDEAPLIADDAEVTVVAAHLVRLATDAVVRPGETIFPSSAYVIGLRAEWMFNAPFETWPIDLQGGGAWSVMQPAASVAESIALIQELMPPGTDDNDQPPA